MQANGQSGTAASSQAQPPTASSNGAPNAAIDTTSSSNAATSNPTGSRPERKQGGKGGGGGGGSSGGNGTHNGKSTSGGGGGGGRQLKGAAGPGSGGPQAPPANTAANAFLGTAAMMNMSPYVNSMAAARLQNSHLQAAAAAACMPYLRTYPQLASTAAGGPYPTAVAGQLASGYPTLAHQNHPVSGYSVSGSGPY